MRFRFVFLGLGSLAVAAALLATDPDKGVATGMLLLALVTPIIAVAFAHLARRGLFDYLDMSEFADRAKQSPIGAGLVFLGTCVVISALLGLFGRSAHAAGAIPARAPPLLPLLAAAVDAHWPEVPLRHYAAGLIEHESCISLTHSRCWSPTSRLLTAREEGAGLGQITRAWHADGTLRFDSLADMRARHPSLRELSWSTIYARPDLQLRALVLMSRANWLGLHSVADPMQRLAFTDLAYNAGPGRVTKDRRACVVTAGCDPQQWWNHVELTCTAGRAPIYGNRSACDISRHHVSDVLRVRAPKYRGMV